MERRRNRGGGGGVTVCACICVEQILMRAIRNTFWDKMSAHRKNNNWEEFSWCAVKVPSSCNKLKSMQNKCVGLCSNPPANFLPVQFLWGFSLIFSGWEEESISMFLNCGKKLKTLMCTGRTWKFPTEGCQMRDKPRSFLLPGTTVQQWVNATVPLKICFESEPGIR